MISSVLSLGYSACGIERHGGLMQHAARRLRVREHPITRVKREG
jgi:hypothetical protein